MAQVDDKAKLRFEEQPGNMELIFLPQCANCKNNIDGTNCRHFGLIPELYQRTKTVYPAIDKE